MRSMMLLMVVCCALPIVILLFGGTALEGSSRWLVFGGLGIAVLVHFLMMRKKGGSCCHDHSEHDGHVKSEESHQHDRT